MSSRWCLEKVSTEPSEVGLGSEMAGVLGHCTGESAASAGEMTVSLSPAAPEYRKIPPSNEVEGLDDRCQPLGCGSCSGVPLGSAYLVNRGIKVANQNCRQLVCLPFWGASCWGAVRKCHGCGIL